MRNHFIGARAAGLVVGVVIALLTAVVSARPAHTAPSASTPASWGVKCSAEQLGLERDRVELAPTLSTDRNPDGTRVSISPDSRGRYTPVLMVHGWTGRGTHNSAGTGAFSHRIDLSQTPPGTANTTRSLIGQLQRVPGAAVFTFDYHPYSARWVDDSHLGPALGKVIDCLYAASGQKIIVVGHSLGGLIARYAATHPGLNGGDRSNEISTVITFGTPATGSLAALLAETGINVGAATHNALATIRLLLAACGKLSTAEIGPGTVCERLPAFIGAFESDAGIALRAGSSQLASLKPWPKTITVNALAGRTHFDVPAGWFSLPWHSRSVDVGDIIVTRSSAVSGASTSTDATCHYQLNATRGATDALGLTFGYTSKSDVAQFPLKAFSGACFHTSLMRNIRFANEATGAVNDDITSRQPVTAASLLSAPVPAACGHRAGVLVNGRLPGIPTSKGFVGLGWILNSAPRTDAFAFGDLTGDGSGDAAAVLRCNAGGSSWPEIIAFYSRAPSGLRLLASLDLSSVNLEGRRPGQNTNVHRLTYREGMITAQWSTQQDYDPAAVATLDYTAALTLRGRSIAVSNLSATTEQATANRYFADLASNNTSDADTISTPGLAATTLAQIKMYPGAVAAALAGTPRCAGLVEFLTLPEKVRVYIAPGGPYEEVGTHRVCYIATGVPGAQYVMAGLKRTDFGQWRVSWFRIN